MRKLAVVSALSASAIIGITVLGSAAPASAIVPSTDAPVAASTLSDVAGGAAPISTGQVGSGVSGVQERLTQIGLTTPITGTFDDATAKQVAHFQEKFLMAQTGIVNAKTASRLLKISKKGANIPSICFTAKKIICIDKTQKVLRLFERGDVVLTTDARFGVKGKRTGEGTFKAWSKIKKEYSHVYKSPMPNSVYFNGGQAIHYSMYFNASGYVGGSHGCVNIRDFAASKQIFNFARVGTKIRIYK